MLPLQIARETPSSPILWFYTITGVVWMRDEPHYVVMEDGSEYMDYWPVTPPKIIKYHFRPYSEDQP